MKDPSKPVFDKTIFHERYFRKVAMLDLFTDQEVIEEDLVEVLAVGEIVEDHDIVQEDVAPMTDKQKFKTILPIVMRIANVASLHGTKQFLRYKDDLETVEKKMRRGTNLFPSGARAAEQIIETSLVDEFFAESEVGTESEPNNNLDETLPEIPLPESNQEPDNFTKFRSILFKEAVKTKGRPKHKTRQVTFNRTALDRQPKSKKVKQSSKSVRQDFIDDNSGDKTTDEESESEVGSNTGSNEGSDSSLKLSSDEAFEDENDREVAFSEKKPNCSNCSKEIKNIADFVLCSSKEQ